MCLWLEVAISILRAAVSIASFSSDSIVHSHLQDFGYRQYTFEASAVLDQMANPYARADSSSGGNQYLVRFLNDLRTSCRVLRENLEGS